MGRDTFCESERKRLDKLNKFQLPNQYKKIGWGVVIVTFLLMIAKKFVDEPSWVKPILSNIFLLGLLMVSLSKEKIEDELIISIRSQSYRFAFIVVVIYSVIQPVANYLVDVVLQKEDPSFDFGYFQVLIFMLIVQLAFFENIKRYR